MGQQNTLREFFDRYASLSLGAEPEQLAELYDTNFLAAGPKGSATFTNDENFLAWLREVRDFNAESGMKLMAVAAVSDSTSVGPDFSLVTVEWAATFERTGDDPIQFSISYLLRDADGTLKIAAYISHEDQEEAMQANGLLEAK
ncbi:MAG: hypothetical protein IBJ03_15850 [Gemmatimonadaceae bacterium]|nr:hypothetical protein [Gemmatimonadaceae bacterium]